MKILILSDDFPPYALGGAASVAFNLARGFVAEKHQVIVITSVQSRSQVGESFIDGIKIYSFYSDYAEKWRAYVSLYNKKAVDFVKKIIDIEKPDVVHAHNIHRHISYHSLKIAKKSGSRVVLTTHDCMLVHYGKFTDFIDKENKNIEQNFNYYISPFSQLKTFKLRYNPFRNIVIKFYLNYVDVITAVSDELKKVLEVNGIKKVIRIYNAIDPSLWAIEDGKVKDFILKNNLENYHKILFSGKLTKAKGGEQLIDSLSNVQKKIKNIAIIIVGQKDSYTEFLVKLAESRGIKVVITGWLAEKDLPLVYSSSDVVVFPSICFDTFGMVNLEAMVVKKPVIATCFGGAKEVVVNNETGFVINPYDIESFSDKITSLLEDPVLSKKMGESGFERVKNMFTVKNQVRNFLEVFKKN